AKVVYTYPIASAKGNWRYAYGNMFYAELVYQFVASMQQGINEGKGGNIQVLESIVGQSLYGGECYMLTAYYVEK
ncbi:hypothetical protein ACPTIM_14930, partial [Enterococcus faecalis]